MQTNNIKKENIKYHHIKREIGICNLSNLAKITVYGPGAIDLINQLSIRDISKIDDRAFYTILISPCLMTFILFVETSIIVDDTLDEETLSETI